MALPSHLAVFTSRNFGCDVRRKSFRVLRRYRHRYNGHCRNFRYKQKNRQGPTGTPRSEERAPAEGRDSSPACQHGQLARANGAVRLPMSADESAGPPPPPPLCDQSDQADSQEHERAGLGNGRRNDSLIGERKRHDAIHAANRVQRVQVRGRKRIRIDEVGHLPAEHLVRRWNFEIARRPSNCCSCSIRSSETARCDSP